MDCKNCCESIDGKPGNGACNQCQHDEEAAQMEQAVSYSKMMMTAMLDSIFKMTKGNYK